MMLLTPQIRAEIDAYTAGVVAARRAYRDRNETGCPTGSCTDTLSCSVCRHRAAKDLIVATSVDECSDLLTILDRRPHPAGRPAAKDSALPRRECGSEAAHKAHLRRDEKCETCRIAANEANRRRREKLK